MILEHAVLEIRPGQESAFERDFATAAVHISSTPGYLSHELHRCHERPNRYVFMARWTTLEAHTEGFRKSEAYPKWKALLHHYYAPMPTVEHFTQVFPAS